MIQLNYRDSRPIYEQVKDGLRRLIVTGVLRPGDKLPSVRALAEQLAINPNTIARAYTALESEGYTVSVAGKGSFVAELDRQNLLRQTELLQKIAPDLEELKQLGLTEEELLRLWRGGNTHA